MLIINHDRPGGQSLCLLSLPFLEGWSLWPLSSFPSSLPLPSLVPTCWGLPMNELVFSATPVTPRSPWPESHCTLVCWVIKGEC